MRLTHKKTELEYTHVHADMYHAVVAGTWVAASDTNQMYQLLLYNSSNAVNNEISFKLYHKAGSYTLEFLCITDVNYGITTISIDGVSQGTVDLYSAAIAYNVLKTLAVTFLTSGLHTINFKVTSKNASATGYYLGLTRIRIKAT